MKAKMEPELSFVYISESEIAEITQLAPYRALTTVFPEGNVFHASLRE